MITINASQLPPSEFNCNRSPDRPDSTLSLLYFTLLFSFMAMSYSCRSCISIVIVCVLCCAYFIILLHHYIQTSKHNNLTQSDISNLIFFFQFLFNTDIHRYICLCITNLSINQMIVLYGTGRIHGSKWSNECRVSLVLRRTVNILST